MMNSQVDMRRMMYMDICKVSPEEHKRRRLPAIKFRRKVCQVIIEKLNCKPSSKIIDELIYKFRCFSTLNISPFFTAVT